jgi:hypothetical protein
VGLEIDADDVVLPVEEVDDALVRVAPTTRSSGGSLSCIFQERRRDPGTR